LDSILEKFPLRGGHGIVFATGGAADIVLARCLASRAMALGAVKVDIVEPLGKASLADKGLIGAGLVEHALEALKETDPDLVLHHVGSRPNPDAPMRPRGKGLRISTALSWEHGERLLCAGTGDGPRVVADRPWMPDRPYDFALGVDGGGDVLTHDEREFDRVVLAAFSSAWQGDPDALGLVVMGLGADGGSAPEDFEGACPPGWRLLGTAEIDEDLANGMERGLTEANLWLDEPLSWSADDPSWDYGFKVPQIIAMAVRRQAPFPCSSPGLVAYPRRKKLTVMSQELLRQARVFVRR
jgi:hypothetical protein